MIVDAAVVEPVTVPWQVEARLADGRRLLRDETATPLSEHLEYGSLPPAETPPE